MVYPGSLAIGLYKGLDPSAAMAIERTRQQRQRRYQHSGRGHHHLGRQWRSMEMTDAVLCKNDDSRTGSILLNSIEHLELNTYRVGFISANGLTFVANACIEKVELSENESIDKINFNSEKYGELVMKGLIASRTVCQAIIAFHRARSVV